MSTSCQIGDLVRNKLAGRKIDPLGFVDELLEIADQVGEIHCTLAGDHGLRFWIPSQAPPFDVQLDAALGKLRMLCARLGVLCHESGDQEVSLYGGEGIIRKEVPVELPDHLGSSSGPGLLAQSTSLAAPPISKQWRVRFKNTPGEQEFTITSAVR
jgi:hypothetical protein